MFLARLPKKALFRGTALTKGMVPRTAFRQYADEPTNLVFTFATPYEMFLQKQEVAAVRVPGMSGEFGIVKGHVPVIAQLKPAQGVVNVKPVGNEEEQEWFISGGFAFVDKDSVCSVNAIEASPLADLDPEAAREGYKKYQADSSKATTNDEKVAAMIGLEVHQAMCQALKISP